MTIAAALRDAEQRLAAARLDDPRLEAEFLLAALLNLSRPQVLLSRQNPLSPSQRRRLIMGVRRRAARWPLAYIVGNQPFRDLTLRVTPAVLIPRPETEELVERALERIRTAERPLAVADIGTGSGCIALSLAGSPRVATVWAVDRSLVALRVARGNARALRRRCRFIQGDLASPLIRRGVQVDLLTANLPYVDPADWRTLSAEVRREPRTALVAAGRGLALITRLIRQAPRVLQPGGTILLEIGIGQSKDVQKLFRASGLWNNEVVHRDAAGIPRVAEAQLT